MAIKNLSGMALKRLISEEKSLSKDEIENGFRAVPSVRNGKKEYNTWDIFIRGCPGTLYEGTVLHAIINFPPDYPINHPEMRFKSKMFHPNIYTDGRVCISILHPNDSDPSGYEKSDEKWTPVQGIRTIVLSVISVLNEPNIVSPANVDASKMFKNNIDEYNRVVKELAKAEFEHVKTITDFR
ncbi:Ubiquitin-conjugating enzyme E2-18 kDa [Astathelohania contejeani]|uniref:Ubiquitin-conjugating enzyme E2-18 kDa n=1 Tax=Astathelohania contejeani TaxID=164912 RepID=A0ABQ7HZ71_9MICR|nr:Ubiquitin-conjugating enzyme E2-18 kDa [Thelohania contejeani]